MKVFSNANQFVQVVAFELSISGGHSHSILAVLTLQSNIMYSCSRLSSQLRGGSVYRNEPSRSYLKARHYLRKEK